MESVVTSIVDMKPKVLAKKKKSILFIVCFGYFMFGLVMCTQAGMYIVQLLDNFVAVLSSLAIGLTEVLVISFVYGSYPLRYSFAVRLLFVSCSSVLLLSEQTCPRKIT